MPRTLDDTAKASLGANLRAARKKHGWTQDEAAKRAGVFRSRLNKWERGKETPGTEGLLTLAITYSCQVDEFLGGVIEGYDEIIESRLPLDAQRYIKSKVDTFIRRTAAAMQLALEPGAPAPTSVKRVVERPAAHGKSKAIRSRRGPGKK